MPNTPRTIFQKSCVFLSYHRHPNLLPIFFNIGFTRDIERHFCFIYLVDSDGIYHHTLHNSMGNSSDIFSLLLPCIISFFTLGVDDGNSCLVDQLRPHIDHPHVRRFVILLHNLVQNNIVDGHHILLHPHAAQKHLYFCVSGQFRHIFNSFYFGSYFLLNIWAVSGYVAGEVRIVNYQHMGNIKYAEQLSQNLPGFFFGGDYFGALQNHPRCKTANLFLSSLPFHIFQFYLTVLLPLFNLSLMSFANNLVEDRKDLCRSFLLPQIMHIFQQNLYISYYVVTLYSQTQAPIDPSRKREFQRSRSTYIGFMFNFPAQVSNNLEEYAIPLFQPPTMANRGPFLNFS